MNITVTGLFHVPPSSVYDLYVISNFVFYIFILHLKLIHGTNMLA
jgi:hypothetical protein